jgi:acetoin utilization deacetylase AcuC-like enzyme
VRVYFSDHHQVPLPVNHRFPMGKYTALRTQLQSSEFAALEFVEAPLASAAELSIAHDLAYVTSFFEGSISANDMRAIGFPWSAALVRRTTASAGGTLAATRHAVRFGGIVANLAGGTHHAARARGSGFCVFNDLAVAALDTLVADSSSRVLVFDADVHQGDGTAAIFADEPRVFTCSIHGARNFPFHKERSNLDFELQDGAGDEEYLAAIQSAWRRSMSAFTPSLVLYQAGVDALAQDKLGRLQVSHTGLFARDQFVFAQAKTLGLPVVMTLGGGYADPIDASVQAHLGTYRAALATNTCT